MAVVSRPQKYSVFVIFEPTKECLRNIFFFSILGGNSIILFYNAIGGSMLLEIKFLFCHTVCKQHYYIQQYDIFSSAIVEVGICIFH